jgi:hypothetical protein
MRVTTTSFFLSFGLLVVTTASYAQSLADVARKEEERRKTQPQSAKVYTNKDLVEVPQSTMPSPAPSGASGTGGSATTTAPAASTSSTSSSAASTGASGAKDDKGASDAKDAPSQTRDRAYWSGRVKAAQDTLDRDATFADALQSRINALTTDFANRDDPAQRATIGRDRDKATAELERLKKKVVEDRKAIADIEEDARRSGVPPGWLR